MTVKELKTAELKEYANNPRNNESAVDKVAASIKQFGFKVPIVVDADSVIVAGHTRLKAAKKLGLENVPCIIADDLTPEQIKAYRLADNKTAEYSEWDFDKLEMELAALNELDFDMEQFGFEELTTNDDLSANLEEARPSLADQYVVPPFSILDTRQGYWQDRKNAWKSFIKSDEGRDDGLLGEGLNQLSKKYFKSEAMTGTSIFDPVLTEILLRWFCPAGGNVIDPFAGGSVRGLVSTFLGNSYTGVDLSAKQIEANKNNFELLKGVNNLNGNELKSPTWINGDSMEIDTLAKGEFDFLMTCPPYADLEVYSDDERDISNMDYPDFKAAYFEILRKACGLLKENAYAAIVVGDVRDKHGYYYNFVGDTVEAFTRAGLKYYNECILVNQIGTGAMRVNGQFSAGRKVVKSHQNVLVFVKGNEKQIDLLPYNYQFEGTE